MVATIGALVLLIAVKLGILPVPLLARPIPDAVCDQVYTIVPGPTVGVVKLTAAVEPPLQTTWFAGWFTTGIGLIVTVNVCADVVLQPVELVTVIEPVYVPGAAAAGIARVIGVGLDGNGALTTFTKP